MCNHKGANYHIFGRFNHTARFLRPNLVEVVAGK